MSDYCLEGDAFCMNNYDRLPAFSSFLPGLAGIRGIPMWVFYTNRGQAINSFGIHTKDDAIMEFNPANTAYENTSVKGFRTFFKCNGTFYEPFMTTEKECQRNLRMKKNSIHIEDRNEFCGIKTEVNYYVLPKECIGALVRHLTVTNVSQKTIELEVLDGIAKILPYGMTNSEYKQMSNLLVSWTEVTNLEHKVPVYKMMASSDDSSEVKEITGGYYMMSTMEGEKLPIIYDPECIFQYDTSLIHPLGFIKQPLSELLEENQYYYNKLPCGFAAAKKVLKPGESMEITSYIGYTDSIEMLNSLINRLMQSEYQREKEAEADALAESLLQDVKTKTANPVFDQYIEQCYMDNFLRGGYPYVFQEGAKRSVVHLFSRKHGDPERDYNFFTIAGEYYSQGNGNYRDVCQNRRNDVFFVTEVGKFNIHCFYSLLQMDGYNPLEIRPSTFVIEPENVEKARQLVAKMVPEGTEKLLRVIEQKYTPGAISNAIAKAGLNVKGEEETLIRKLLSLSRQEVEAGFKEGYWCDHWDYNLDLVENYLMIYPDKKMELLFCDRDYRYYDSLIYVLPRRDSYILTQHGVRQYQAIVSDQGKLADPVNKEGETNWLRNQDGSYVESTLFVKMLILAANKFSSLDPCGMGISMDGGKPGWNDALNGLPGLLGSSMAETCELSRLLSFLVGAIEECGEQFPFTYLPMEAATFLEKLMETVETSQTLKLSEQEFWEKRCKTKEAYRAVLRERLSGDEKILKKDFIYRLLSQMQAIVEDGIGRALKLNHGILPTYFSYEAVDYELQRQEDGTVRKAPNEHPYVIVKGFQQVILPNFLEGPARSLPIIDPEIAKNMYQEIKKSFLYDEKLKMYKTSESLEQVSYEIGRIRAFTPGWLERESIFLHMEYKYFYSLLKAGLYDEFYEAIQDALIPFLSPDQYGRSILENSSFLASSVNPNPSVWGRGYVARLSGSTVEMLSMWIRMFAGSQLFTMKEQTLTFQLSPVLPSEFFDEEGVVEFQLMSKCKVIYHNPSRKATYGKDGAKATRMVYYKHGVPYTTDLCELTGDDAFAMRNGEIEQIEVEFDA